VAVLFDGSVINWPVWGLIKAHNLDQLRFALYYEVDQTRKKNATSRSLCL